MKKLNVPTAGANAIEILENDHEAVKRLFAEMAADPEPATCAPILEQLKALLTVHNATEENLVYPAVRIAAGRAREADTLYHQQDEAKVGVWELDAMLKGSLEAGDFSARVEKLEKAVLAHIRKEEETEYPHLRDALKGQGLKQLTADVIEFREKFRFDGTV